VKKSGGINYKHLAMHVDFGKLKTDIMTRDIETAGTERNDHKIENVNGNR
jgi:hypothetical protein